MDPKLRELLAEGEPRDELEVILKLRSAAIVPPGARLVARFGDVATARIRREDVRTVWENPDVLSIKAPRLVIPGEAGGGYRAVAQPEAPRPEARSFSGRGVVVAVLDWGCDVTHANFRRTDGGTRLLALWHQGLRDPAGTPEPYGYGRVFERAAIDAALAAPDPFARLGYHPAQSDPGNEGTHGTHVLDIAAGSGAAPGSPRGVAPDADLVFVHLATEALEPLATLGDTVRILEGLDFVRRVAGERPWVANLSLGRHGGPHNGKTLVEQGIDALLIEAPGRAVVQSCGNYFAARAHATGRLRPGRRRLIGWRITPADRTPNEIEIWYPGRDTLGVRVAAPDGAGTWVVPLGSDAPIVIGGARVGHAYHRAFDPAAGDHHVDIFLEPAAPSGVWRITLTGIDVVDGRYHAWVERDAACATCQSHLESGDVVQTGTTGTICNGLRGIAVGAYDAASPLRALGAFSSAGPTRDGRVKPDLVAPGVSITAARSAPSSGAAPPTTVKSGTSMASPHVTGTIACMFEAAGRPLRIQETRTLLLGSTDPTTFAGIDQHRMGSGYLNQARAVAATVAARTGIEETVMTAEQESDWPQRQWIGEAPGEAEQMGDAAEESTDEESAEKLNFVLLSGGPGPFDTRDVEHDKSWSNYVDPPLLLAGRARFWIKREQVWWFVYKPAYEDRWVADNASTATRMQKDHVARVRSKGFGSYVELLEKRAEERGWKLRWLATGDELWTKLKTFRKGSVTRLWYWGHARDDLWLTVSHTSGGSAAEPADAGAVLKAAGIDASVRDRFAAGKRTRSSRFIGCNTASYAKQFATALKVETEGVTGKIDFGTLHTTGGDPCLVAGATIDWFDKTGTAVSAADVTTTWAACGAAAEAVEAMEDDDETTGIEGHYDPTDAALEAEAPDPAERLVETAECVIHARRHGLPEADSASARDDAGNPESALMPWLASGARAARFAREVLGEPGRFGARIIGRPGEPLRMPVRAGDVIVRMAPGEPVSAHSAVVFDASLLEPPRAVALGWQLERGGTGRYALVIEDGPRPHCRHDRFGRRVLDAFGRVPFGQLVLRSGTEAETAPDAPPETLAETGPTVRVRAQNRLVRHDTIAGCRVELAGTAAAGTTGSGGSVTLDLTSVADGTHTLTVTPAATLAAGTPVGPAAGSTAPTPDRIWRPFAAEVTVRGGRIVATTSADLDVASSGVVAKVQPVWMRSPNQSSRGGTTLDHIVVHHTAGPAIGPAINTFLSTSEARSAHYIIDVDGQVVKMVHEGNQSWHAGASNWAGRDQVNRFSVGIEIVHRSGPYPAAQYAALIDLLNTIRGAHPGIAAAHVIGHSDIGTIGSPRRLGRKSGDPGLTFEWERLEAAGLGIVRPPLTPADVGLGGYFALRPTGRLRSGDRDDRRRYGGRAEPTLPNTIVNDLQSRLRCIGYLCPLNGRYESPTEWAVRMFQEHFCAGTRPRPARNGEVDLVTAEALQAIVSTLACPAAPATEARSPLESDPDEPAPALATPAGGAFDLDEREPGIPAWHPEPPPLSDRAAAEQAADQIDWCRMRQAIVAAARCEEARWTRNDGTKLVESDARQRFLMTAYWLAVPGVGAATAGQRAQQSAADARAWSAAFICFVMRAAGIEPALGFEFSERHLGYIVGALRNRERSDRNRPFWLVDHVELRREATPQPGDLLCFNRPDDNGNMTAHTYSNLRQRFWSGGNQNVEPRGASHCRVVVGSVVRGGQRFLETIGGNETHSVRTQSDVPVDPSGGIPDPQAHGIFGMIKITRC